MYDPHRLRRNDRRYYTRKGQIIQAKAFNAPFTIESNKVEAYKEYILQNKLIPKPPTPPPPPPLYPITIEGLLIKQGDDEGTLFFNEFEYTSESQYVSMVVGTKLCFLVNEQNGNLNFRIFYSQETAYEVPGKSWWYATALTKSNPIIIKFVANDSELFNVELNSYSNHFQAYADVEFPYDTFKVPLPAPSG